MRADNVVPDVQLLKRFLLGQLSGAEAEPIERYLEQHPDLASTLAELVKEDTLIGSLRASAGKDAVDPPELAGLMDKLSQLRPPPASDATVDSDGGKCVAGSSGGDATFVGLGAAQAADEIGRLGGYRVLKVLGAGGMGMVYQAEDVHLQRPVALKVMKAEVAKNPIARDRFLREARAAAKLKSDHVVNVYQVGEDN
jgi:anti-sigma factor RsiW